MPTAEDNPHCKTHAASPRGEPAGPTAPPASGPADQQPAQVQQVFAALRVLRSGVSLKGDIKAIARSHLD